MPYIKSNERQESMVNAAVRLASFADFQTLCDSLVSDLVDKQNAMMEMDGTALTRMQGAAVELKRILEAIHGAQEVSAKIAMSAEMKVRANQGLFIQMPGTESDQA